MNSRPYYAMTLLLIMLVAAMQLLGTSQPCAVRAPKVALAPRPVVREAQQPARSPLYALRHRQPKSLQVAQEQSGAFVDHHAVMTAVFNVASNGIGGPLSGFASTTHEADANVVLVAPAAESAAVAVLVKNPGRIGFDELTAIVNHSLPLSSTDQQFPGDDQLVSLSGEDTDYSYQSGCGLDRTTGEVYSPLAEIEPADVATNAAPNSSVWSALVRSFRAYCREAFATSALSSIPSMYDTLGQGIRRDLIR